MNRTVYTVEPHDFEEQRRILISANDASEGGLITSFTRSLGENLARDRKSYRAFGPYWWVVKRILIGADAFEVGTYIDTKWHDQCDCGDDDENVVISWCYFLDKLEQGRIHDRRHVLWLRDAEGSEFRTTQYSLLDRDMERKPGFRPGHSLRQESA